MIGNIFWVAYTGTNLFSAFLGGLTDVFGGRSHTYQKQLTSLYNEATERVKFAAHEIGANCIIGLSIDLDEISGKGKSMFMITAIGTAVIIENTEIQKTSVADLGHKSENVPSEKINILRKKKALLQKASDNQFILDDDTWDFIISNQIKEIFPYVLEKLSEKIADAQSYADAFSKFNSQFLNYVESFEETSKQELLYEAITKTKKNNVVDYLLKIINDLNLFDFEKCMELLQSDDFNLQKLGLTISTYDQFFYNKADIHNLDKMINFIESTFQERGKHTTKKQLLSSKEIEAWNCECGKNNNTDKYCSGCNKDIFGFTQKERKPQEVVKHIKQKIALIQELMQ